MDNRCYPHTHLHIIHHRDNAATNCTSSLEQPLANTTAATAPPPQLRLCLSRVSVGVPVVC